MASILLVTTTSSDYRCTRLKTELETLGHAVTVAEQAALPANAAGADLIALAALTDEGIGGAAQPHQQWIADRWNEGTPLLFGAAWNATSANYSTMSRLGLGTAVYNFGSTVGTATSVTVLTSHPVVAGFTGTVAVRTPADSSCPSTTAGGVVSVAALTGRSEVIFKVIDKGAACATGGNAVLSPGTAPARAAHAGWLPYAASALTADGRTILRQTVNWLAPPAGPVAHPAEVTLDAAATVTAEPTRTPTQRAAEATVDAGVQVLAEPGVVTPGTGHAAETSADTGADVAAEPAAAHTAEATADTAVEVVVESAVTPRADDLEAESRTTIRSTVAGAVDVDYLTAETRTTVTSSAALTLDVTVNPSTGRPDYRLLLVDRHGESLGELPNARLGAITRTRNGTGSFTFSLDKDDPRLHKVRQFSEVQVRIGGRLVPGAWFVIVDPKIDNGHEWTFQCAGLRWHLASRRIGKELPELLRNGDFDQDERFWHAKWFEGSAAEAAPDMRIVTGDKAMEGGKALEVTGVERISKQSIQSNAIFLPNRPYVDENIENGFVSGGKKVITDAIKKIAKDSPVTVEGHTADADAGDGYALSVRRAEAAKQVILAARPDLKVTAVGKGETEQVAPNDTEANQAKNRRLVIIATITSIGHRQAVTQRGTYRQPKSARRPMELLLDARVNLIDYVGPSKDGWLLYIDRRRASKPKEINDASHSTIAEDFPVERWTTDGIRILIPADGQKWIYEVRLYPTAGKTRFDQVSLRPNIYTAWYGITRPEAIRNLVRHAQDPEFHKADLNIGTNCKPFGPRDDFEYAWLDRRTVDDAISEELRSNTSPDFEVVVTDHRRIATTWANRGRRTHVPLKLGDRVTDYTSGLDGDKVASTAILQASRERGSKGEAIARTTRTDGLVLERLFDAEQGSTDTVLRAQARAALRYGRTDVITSVTCDPNHTLWLLERIDLGDICPVQIDDAGLDANGDYRIEEITLDPNTHRLTYRLAVEG